MTEEYFVATDRNGLDQSGAVPIEWHLPMRDAKGWQSGETSTGALVLRRTTALLDVLDECIFVASFDEVANPGGAESLEVATARLTRGTVWDVTSAAIFALDCAEHATSSMKDPTLPDGTTLASVIGDARRVLSATGDGAEHRLGARLALAVARRLRTKNEQVTDLAREFLTDDVERDLDAIGDPNYAATASVADAVLAAIEAVRHIALPRYFNAVDPRSDSEPAPVPSIITTPWGPIAIGAEHHSPYEPAWVSAKDAAKRARDAARDRLGADGEQSERQLQGLLLHDLLT